MTRLDAPTESKPSNGPTVVSGLGAAPPSGAAESPLKLDGRTYERALDCVHCGLCLPACPTYTENGLEADSPRGRIVLIKGLADGRIALTDQVTRHLDLCLDCRACETACPSGVRYHELIEETRERLPAPARRRWVDRLLDIAFFHVFPHPPRLKTSLLPARLMQKAGLWRLIGMLGLTRRLPAQLAKMQQMLPDDGPIWETSLRMRYRANAPDGKRRATVALLSGCVGSVLFQHVNRQTIELLQHAGCEVIVPRDQTCCGAIHHHGGRGDDARRFAAANLKAFLDDVEAMTGDLPDAIVTNIAGCGAMLRDYAHLMRDDPDEAKRAELFASRVRDISELLVTLDLPDPPHPVQLTATYHDACHLAHAQRVTDPPRRLLSRIRGLTLVPLVESDMCCGAAGTYNLSEPEMAGDLAARKIRHITDTGASMCITGNVGCAMQIASEAKRLGRTFEVSHPVSVLHDAYFGSDEK